MADTLMGRFGDKQCSDCGGQGCVFYHNGPLVPAGKVGYFCSFCWVERKARQDEGLPPLPLGIKAPYIPEEFRDKKIKVTTKNGSVYTLGLTSRDNERVVSREGEDLDFKIAMVMSVAVGKSLFLKIIDDESNDSFRTSPVVSIEAA